MGPRRTIGFAAVMGCMASVAAAHPVSLSRATVAVQQDAVDVSIEAPAEDLLHFGLLPLVDDDAYPVEAVRTAAVRYAPMVSEGLILRDETGARLTGAVTSVTVELCEGAASAKITSTWITMGIRYSARPQRPLRFLTFQHRPNSAAAALRTHLAVAVRQAGQNDRVREIVLTGGCNVETLEFDWKPDAASQKKTRRGDSEIAGAAMDGRAWLGDDRFKTVHAIIDIDRRGIVARVVVPVVVAEAWEPASRGNEDVLTTDEQATIVRQWRKCLAVALDGTIDGRKISPVLEDVRVIGPADSERSTPAAPAKVGFHSARLVGTIRLSSRGPARAMDLNWRLFNEAVPAVRVLVVSKAGGAEEHNVSTYAPVIHWRRGYERKSTKEPRR